MTHSPKAMNFCVCGHSKIWHAGAFPFACRGRSTTPNGCGCKRFRPKAADVLPGGFSDRAKQRHGIEQHDAPRFAALEAELQRVRDVHAAEIASLREWFKSALAALEGGRRGDALKILRGQTENGSGEAVPPTVPTEPNRA